MMNEEPITTANVWRTLSDRLRAFLRSRVAAAEVEDLLQEVFLRVHKNLDALAVGDRLESWVFQIARNAVNDHYRRGRSRPQLDLTAEQVEAPPPEPLVENLNQAVAGWLTHAVEMLPDKQRQAVRLYELQGMSHQAIAARFGISLSGAKSRVQRGRKQLADILRACCELEWDARGNVIDCQSAGGDRRGQQDCDCASDACG